MMARWREFALLKSIGMTNRQLRNILCLEGLYYVAGMILISMVLGVVSSLFVIQSLMGGLWFLTYRFIIMPIVICCPNLIVLSLLIPMIAFSGTMKESVVEGLREAE